MEASMRRKDVTGMKLAEALQERADLNRKLAQLQQRLEINCIVQEGEAPAEEPSELLSELNEAADRLQALIAAINLTNSATSVDGTTLTELIAARDVLSVRLAAYRSVISEASHLAQRATRSEIRILSAIDVKALQKAADDMARDLRLTDNTLQETNWKTELIGL